MTNQLFFLASFGLTFYLTLFNFVKMEKKEIPEPVAVVLAEQTTLPTSIDSPTPTPTLKPVITQKPTPSPTPMQTQTPEPTSTVVPSPTATPDVWSPPDLEPIFARFAGQYGIDKNLIERIANCESHFNSNAKNGDYLGMFQFSTSTWINMRNEIGFDSNPDLRLNSEESIRTAAYLVSKRGSDPWPSCLR